MEEFCLQENIPISWEAGTKVEFEELITISDFCITTSVREGSEWFTLSPGYSIHRLLAETCPLFLSIWKIPVLPSLRFIKGFLLTKTHEINDWI